MIKKALITGITGQDGSYLAEFLLSKGYQVHGIIRRASTFNTVRIDSIFVDPHDPKARLFLHFGDLSDAEQISNLIYNIKPDEIYHLGAQSVIEECLCPILSAQKVSYRTLGNLWDEQVKKSKRVKIENINGTRIEVIELPVDTQLKALGMWNGMGTWFPIKQISRHWWKGKVVRMSQKFGSVTVTPNHSVLDISQKICRPEDNPWLLNVRKLNYKPNKYKNNISLKLNGAYKSDKDSFWLEEKGIPGKVLKIIKEDKIKPFCRFVGAFIAEGHTTYNIANGNWYVGISSNDKKWLEGLGVDLKSFYNGKYWYIRHKKGSYKDVWELQIKSRALYNLFRKLLGTDSKAKKLPYWFSQIKKEYLKEIWEKMLEGDGCIDKKSGFRYTTSSYELACQLSWLFTVLGFDYTVNEEINGPSTFWHFRECTTYQPYQGEKDKKIIWVDYNGWVYDITVEGVHNFAVGVGNIVVHNSHVRVSFDIPEYTGNVTALGTVRLLEAIRRSGHKIKFYNAASSEMFGAAPAPQSETTAFQPQSPYACAKVYAYWMVKNYREGYGLFACNGILFNHETVASFMPMFYKKAGEEGFDIKPIAEIVPFDKSIKKYQSQEVSGICVWGKGGWVEVKYASAYPHDVARDNKKPRFINSRSGAFMATSSHVGFMEGGNEKEVGDMAVGDCLEVIDFPECKSASYGMRRITEEEAELLGMMVGDGSITYSKRGIGINGKFTNSSPKIRDHFNYLWTAVTGGYTKYYPTRSGFNPAKIVGQLCLNGGNDWLRGIDIYNEDRTKRVPRAILNSETSVMLAFLRGYNATDGLKSNPCTYEFKNFKTNSATLAMGLWYLVEKTTKQDVNLTVETKDDGRIFYSLNLLSTVDNNIKESVVEELVLEGVSQREMSRLTGISRTFIRKIQYGGSACSKHHFHMNPFEIKKIIEMSDYQGWFCDLETSSGEFHCGIGKTHVHNSPRRGETFVTRKITRGLANIMAGRQKKLYLGNLDAKRDWGFAPEFVQMMWLMLQQKKPDDYVVGTGESHSVKEFVQKAFAYAGLDWKKYVEIDKQYFRPNEVDHLKADITKAKNKLQWQPKVKFNELIKIMGDYDLKAAGVNPPGEGIEIYNQKRFSYIKGK